MTNGPAGADFDPAAIVYGNEAHVFYRDEPGNLWDSWYDATTGRWSLRQMNLNGLTHAPAAAGAPAPFVYYNQLHVLYADSEGTIWDVWFDGHWNLQQINRGGLTSGFAADSYLVPFVYKNQAHVLYRINDGTLWDAWYDGAGHWDILTIRHWPILVHYAESDPAAYVFNDHAHVLFRNSTGWVWDSQYEGDETKVNLGGATDGPAAEADPVPFVYHNQVHILYTDKDGAVWDSWYGAVGHWNLQRINRGGVTNGPAAANMPAPVVYGNEAHVFYRDDSGKIWDSWYDSATGRWSLRQINLGGLTSGPKAEDDIVPFVYLNQLHILYEDSGGKIWDSWFVNH